VPGTLTAPSTSVFTIALTSLSSNGKLGAIADFDNRSSYSWLIATASAVSDFNASEFAIDTSGFANSLSGGSFSVSNVGNNLYLNFNPASVPEPGTLALCAGPARFGGRILGHLRRKRPRVVVRLSVGQPNERFACGKQFVAGIGEESPSIFFKHSPPIPCAGPARLGGRILGHLRGKRPRVVVRLSVGQPNERFACRKQVVAGIGEESPSIFFKHSPPVPLMPPA